ncbi:hypothetical protein ACTXT7_009079 [Hymenolepis weldensis]
MSKKIRWEHNGEEIQQSGIRSFHISNSDTGHELVLISVDTNFAGRYTIIAENHRGVAACSAMLTQGNFLGKVSKQGNNKAAKYGLREKSLDCFQGTRIFQGKKKIV